MDKHIYGNSPFPVSEDGFSFLGRVEPSHAGQHIDAAFVDADISAGGPGVYVGVAVTDGKRAAFFAALFLSLFVVLVRAVQVQVAQGADYQEQAEGNRSRLVAVPVERGVMYDRGGTPLVRNNPMFAAAVTAADLPKPKNRKDPADVATAAAERAKVLGRLAAIVGVGVPDLEKTLDELKEFASTPQVVAQDLTHDQAVLLRIAEAELPGVRLESVQRREYLEPVAARSLAHVLGYEGRITEAEYATRKDKYAASDLIGKSGLERQYEDVLRGHFGRRRVEVDPLGRQKSVIAEEKGDAGRNLILALDLDVQKTAEKALRDQLKIVNRKRGSVVVTNPRTGEVLALVSEPSFDVNLFSHGISADEYKALNEDPDHPLFPRAIAASLPSGSVFKPVMAAAALDEKIVTPQTSFLSTGGLRVGQSFFPDWRAGGHGMTDVYKALAESVNTYFYIVGGGHDGRAGLGVEKITEYARKFGLGSPTGIDLPGEGAGFLPSKEWKERVKGERWYLGDTYHLSIGQGDLLVTPLQINVMTMAVANGGDLLKPRLVNAVTSTDGTRTDYAPVVVARQVVSPSAIRHVQAGMRQAVTKGSARSLSDLPVSASAKTGTAQWNSAKSNHAWFTAYAPSEKPEIVVTVMIEEGIEGSSNGAPVAKKILAKYFAGRGDRK